MISVEAAGKAVKLARATAENEIKGEGTACFQDLGEELSQMHGVFVTFNRFPSHDLRACIGYPEPFMTVGEAVSLSARGAVHDPRFPKLTLEELGSCTVEITVLTKPEKLNYRDTLDLLSQIKIGRDGLAVGFRDHHAIFLPQVPVEQGWEREEYLSHLCVKAGLPPDAWMSGRLTFQSFQGEVFEEKEPSGAVVKRG